MVTQEKFNISENKEELYAEALKYIQDLENQLNNFRKAAHFVADWARHGATCRGFTDETVRHDKKKFQIFREKECSCGIRECKKLVRTRQEMKYIDARTWENEIREP